MDTRGLMSGCSRCFTHLHDDDRFWLLLQALLGWECNLFFFFFFCLLEGECRIRANCGKTMTSEVTVPSSEVG